MNSTSAWPKLKRDLVAILRRITPGEIDAAIGTLCEAGFEAIEIPLNSPEPFRSIKQAAIAGENCLIGAGTVLTRDDVFRLRDAGGRLMVSPNIDVDVLTAAGEAGMVTMPGVLTPSEALLACSAGASALKFFPASMLGPAGIAAIRTILPPQAIVGAVGGIDETSFGAYAGVGIRVFGLGSSLYKPGISIAELKRRAEAAVEAYDAAFPPNP